MASCVLPSAATCHVGLIPAGLPLGKRRGHFDRGERAVSILTEGYGLTETSAAITVNRIGDRARASWCRATMKVAEDGESAGRGRPWCSAATGTTRKATAEAIVLDAWFPICDLASVDAEGFLSITGRKKEIIVTAIGNQVPRAALEDGTG